MPFDFPSVNLFTGSTNGSSRSAKEACDYFEVAKPRSMAPSSSAWIILESKSWTSFMVEMADSSRLAHGQRVPSRGLVSEATRMCRGERTGIKGQAGLHGIDTQAMLSCLQATRLCRMTVNVKGDMTRSASRARASLNRSARVRTR